MNKRTKNILLYKFKTERERSTIIPLLIAIEARLTPADRIAAYTYAINKIRTNLFVYPGICGKLNQWMSQGFLERHRDIHSILQLSEFDVYRATNYQSACFPEFVWFAPRNPHAFTAYWWKSNAYIIRICVLYLCIFAVRVKIFFSTFKPFLTWLR